MKRIFKVLAVLAGLICIGSLVMLLKINRTYEESNEEYQELAYEAVQVKNLTEQAEQEEVPPLLSVDFEDLQSINEEVCAWIDFPGQERSYPVVHGEDNEYYLNRTFRKNPNSGGSIFADARNEQVMGDDNTVLYGHNMRNLSMFGFLRKYQEEAHYQAFPYFDIYLPETIYRCQILSCCKVAADWNNFPTQFETEEERASFIRKMKNSCAYETSEVDSTQERPLVMLTTCTGQGYDYRLVVLAEAYVLEEQTGE